MSDILTLEEMKKIKNSYGLSCSIIAEKSGVPESTVNKVFGGVTKPRQSTLQALSVVFVEYGSQSTKKKVDYGDIQYEELLKKYGYTDYLAEESHFQDKKKDKKNNKNTNTDDQGSGDQDLVIKEALIQGTSAKKIDKKRDGEFTVGDYLRLPENIRAELIDGYFFEMNSPSYIHQTILLDMAYQIKTGIRKNKGKCNVYVAPADVQLGDDEKTMVQPDLFIICNRDMKKHHNRFCDAPDFIAEIVSESTRRKDSTVKLNKYMKEGVREYWLVDPHNGYITVYLFDKADFTKIYTFDDTVPIDIYEGKISVDFGEITAELIETYGDYKNL